MACIVVMGPGRSGTSTVAGILFHLGVFMGEDLWEASVANQKGFFEDREFWNLHHKMHEETTHELSLDFPPLEFRPTEKTLKEYVHLIRKREQHDLWGIKDPMMCFALRQFLDTITTQVKIITIRRPFNKSVRSLLKQGFCKSLEHGIIRHARYLFAMEESLSRLAPGKFAIMDLEYEELVRDPASHVQRISEFIGVSPTPEALAFIDPNLDRHKNIPKDAIVEGSEQSVLEIYESYVQIKIKYDQATAELSSLRSHREQMDAYHILDEEIATLEGIARDGRVGQAYAGFGRMLSKINVFKGILMNNMAVLLVHLGRPEKAKELLQYVLKEGYTSEEAKANLALLEG